MNEVSISVYGFNIIREHEQHDELLLVAHRFRSSDEAGFFALAKDLARLTADSFDASAIQKIVAPPKGVRWGSLKSLENLVSLHVGPEQAHTEVGPLAGIYELRHPDAHLRANDLSEAFELAGIDISERPEFRGLQLIDVCVSAIWSIADALKEPGIQQ